MGLLLVGPVRTTEWTHPAVYHASPRYESEEGFSLLDQRLPNAVDQTVQPPEAYFYAAGHVECMETGAVVS